MTANEALIVCRILQRHGYGDLEMTVECGYTSIGCYPDYLQIPKGYIDMEGSKYNGKWNVADKTLIPVCEEIESALQKSDDGNKARWIDKDGLYECSRCGAECGVMSKFCSDCGAEMNGE